MRSGKEAVLTLLSRWEGYLEETGEKLQHSLHRLRLMLPVSLLGAQGGIGKLGVEQKLAWMQTRHPMQQQCRS